MTKITFKYVWVSSGKQAWEHDGSWTHLWTQRQRDGQWVKCTMRHIWCINQTDSGTRRLGWWNDKKFHSFNWFSSLGMDSSLISEQWNGNIEGSNFLSLTVQLWSILSMDPSSPVIYKFGRHVWPRQNSETGWSWSSGKSVYGWDFVTPNIFANQPMTCSHVGSSLRHSAKLNMRLGTYYVGLPAEKWLLAMEKGGWIWWNNFSFLFYLSSRANIYERDSWDTFTLYVWESGFEPSSVGL